MNYEINKAVNQLQSHGHLSLYKAILKGNAQSFEPLINFKGSHYY